MELGEIGQTPRGFKIIEFADRDGIPCSLQQSSVATYQEPGSSAIWLGVEDKRMHLDRQQTRALINHLINWLTDNSFREVEAINAESTPTG